jgi:hypothetical protein
MFTSSLGVSMAWIKLSGVGCMVLPTDPILISLQMIVGLTEEVRYIPKNSGQVRRQFASSWAATGCCGEAGVVSIYAPESVSCKNPVVMKASL